MGVQLSLFSHIDNIVYLDDNKASMLFPEN